jgi:hypothetical protein
MLEPDDEAGDGICGLCAAKYISPGDKSDAAGEYTEIIAGESRSEIVWHPTADGVALCISMKSRVCLILTYMLPD